MEGLEPTRLAAPDPKSGTSTNFATSASRLVCLGAAKLRKVFEKPNAYSIIIRKSYLLPELHEAPTPRNSLGDRGKEASYLVVR